MTTLNADELNDACLHAAATCVVAFAYGSDIFHCQISEDDLREPLSRVDLSDSWSLDDEILWSRNRQGRSCGYRQSARPQQHVVLMGTEDPYDVLSLLDDEKIWKPIKLLPVFKLVSTAMSPTRSWLYSRT